jgi:Tfp pilus assembly protein PilO
MNAALKQSSWLVTLPLAAIAVAYLALVWSPGRKAIKQTREQVADKQKVVAQSADLSAKLISAQQELEKDEAVVRRWEEAAPKKRDIPGFCGKITALAKTAHLEVTRFDPQPAIIHEKLQQIPMAMTCMGTFAQVYEFLRAIEAVPTTIWVESMRLEKTALNKKGIQCELNLAVFSNNPQNSDYARHSD